MTQSDMQSDDMQDDEVTQPGRGSERVWWLDKKSNVDKVFKCVVGLFFGFVSFDFLALLNPGGLFDGYDSHAHFPFENFPGFYGWYGFAGCVILVLCAKELRKLVMRDEWYYDAEEKDPVLPDPNEGGNHGH